MTTAVSASASSRPTIAAILAVSAAATLFLFWLIYVHPAADTGNTRYAFLPALNAIFNGLAATSLLIGYGFIRARKLSAHRASMITAFVFSTLFLVSYIVHHALHGDVRYPAHAALRSLYLTLLTSHIVLAVVALPMVLMTFFFSLAGRFQHHRRIARWTFPFGFMSRSPASSPTSCCGWRKDEPGSAKRQEFEGAGTSTNTAGLR